MTTSLTSATLPQAAPGTPAPSGPPTELAVPSDILALLRGAVKDGLKLAGDFARTHPVSERWMIGTFAESKMTWPPKTDDAELARMHEIVKLRTPADNESAKFWAEHGLDAKWKSLLAEYSKKVGPNQARAAAKLLDDTLAMVNESTQINKASNLRTRPFVKDPTLPMIMDKPGNNPSFPSGHTSAAYAAATVLSYLMPERQTEIMNMAEQASYARVYAAMHFPSDIEAGAKLATTIAAYMVGIAPQAYGIRPDQAGAARAHKRSKTPAAA